MTKFFTPAEDEVFDRVFKIYIHDMDVKFGEVMDLCTFNRILYVDFVGWVNSHPIRRAKWIEFNNSLTHNIKKFGDKLDENLS
jgi:hypothetical protein